MYVSIASDSTGQNLATVQAYGGHVYLSTNGYIIVTLIILYSHHYQ
jgi:hypothetical protein